MTSFDKAFAQARREGKKIFVWRGKRYRARTKEEGPLSFDVHFANARKAGKKTFMWKGRLYTTRLRGEGTQTWYARLKKHRLNAKVSDMEDYMEYDDTRLRHTEQPKRMGVTPDREDYMEYDDTRLRPNVTPDQDDYMEYDDTRLRVTPDQEDYMEYDDTRPKKGVTPDIDDYMEYDPSAQRYPTIPNVEPPSYLQQSGSSYYKQAPSYNGFFNSTTIEPRAILQQVYERKARENSTENYVRQIPGLAGDYMSPEVLAYMKSRFGGAYMSPEVRMYLLNRMKQLGQ